ncbi:MAG: AAA family ATPase [Planctomycetota bacterium]
MADGQEEDQEEDRESVLRKLAASDPFDRHAAIESLRALDVETLVGLAKHPVIAVRAGVARAIEGRTEDALVEVARKLAGDGQEDVREALAETIATAPDWALPDAVLVRLARDQDSDVASRVIDALARRPSCIGTLGDLVREEDVEWDVRREVLRALENYPDHGAAVRALLDAIAIQPNDWVARESLRIAELHVEALDGAMPEDLGTRSSLASLAKRVRGWQDVHAPGMRAFLDRNVPAEPDLSGLADYGRELTHDARRGLLPHAFRAEATLEAIERVLMGDGPRSVVLSGPSGCGKSAIVHELAHRLAALDEPWHVVRVTPSEMLVGTKYLGEWQTRVRNLVELVAAPQRVLLYIPHIAELSDVGASEQNEQATVATLLAPEIESGRIAVLGETTAESWSRGMGSKEHLKRLFARVDVLPLSRAATREVLDLVVLDAGADVDPEALDATLDVADVYLSDIELPGRAVGLLRRMIADRDRDSFGRADVLRTLQEATGVPPDFIDDSIPLRLDLIRDFLGLRVMGQGRAVEQVLDLVTLIKAGLDDPNKPSGVLLFVGPTGVGKTELSRALAELLFGSPSRLLRFDMSEYASYESYERLIGTPTREGTLTAAVRRQPFSVVLLDEIEKAHMNVFDLCLGLFDAGRLTDGKGRTVSFRKTIMVMTSNLGAKVETEAGIGFGDEAPPPPSTEEIQKALREFFRPEFLGRVDHVVPFDALSTETADRIARREVEKVLARGGLTRRRVSVDVDDGVVALLLRRGYSPALGARPLKRAVESLLLMPIARVLASGEARPGACVQVRVEGDRLTARLVPPDDDEGAVGPEPAALPALEQEVEHLERLRGRADEVEAQRADLLERTTEPGFWDDARAAADALDAVHRLERVLEEFTRLESDLEVTGRNPSARHAARFVERHAYDLRRLERLLDADDLGDAYLRLTAVRSSEGDLDGVERLARMYTAWTRRRGMEATVLDDRRATHDSEDSITLAIEGAGAHALLAREAGLHKLRRDLGGGRHASELVRVEVFPAPHDGGVGIASEVRAEARPLRDAAGRLVTTLSSDVHLLHRPTMTSLRAWSPKAGTDAIEPLTGFLAAVLAASAAPHSDVVRAYGFGPSSVIRDRRSGRSTGRVDRVLGGELHLVADL